MRPVKRTEIAAVVDVIKRASLLQHTSDADYQTAISWSSHLDPLFTNNLEGDAALSWQYFGSSSGFLRRYPGTGWPLEQAREARPLHDFRTDDWFVQAASSPKDIVSWVESRVPGSIALQSPLIPCR